MVAATGTTTEADEIVYALRRLPPAKGTRTMAELWREAAHPSSRLQAGAAPS